MAARSNALKTYSLGLAYACEEDSCWIESRLVGL